ncbi:MAG: hypothetical protein COA43_01905 [Robiginitomaculum sp.]|nr:MAG: hypothetical protein COA43_01905 [Robiginitomaculum sp.]
MALIDTLLARRQKLLLMAAFGFAMWQGGQLLAKMFPIDDTTQAIALAMTLVGAFQWAACSFGFIHYSKKAKPERDALNDELTCRNRGYAFTFGYTVLVGFIMFLFALNAILEQTTFPALNADFIIHGLMIIGIIAPTLRFVWLERDNA